MKPRKKSLEIAEMYGSTIGLRMVDDVFTAQDQSEAFRAIKAGLLDAFSQYDDKIDDAIAGGLAVAIVNVLERGRDAIRQDPPCDPEAY